MKYQDSSYNSFGINASDISVTAINTRLFSFICSRKLDLGATEVFIPVTKCVHTCCVIVLYRWKDLGINCTFVDFYFHSFNIDCFNLCDSK